MLKTSLQLRHSQQLVMTPQLQQAIRLLQLSTVELSQEIRHALETNIMLEVPEGPEPSSDEALREPEPRSDDAWEEPAAENGAEAVETLWESGETEVVGSWEAPDWREQQDTSRPALESLQAHLEWQLAMTSMSDTDRIIAAVLIDGLDDAGYLGESLDEIRRGLEPELKVNIEEIEAVLHRLQCFDPVGVGARNLRECLLVQLRQLAPATPALAVARQLVSEHLDLLAEHRHDALQRLLRTDAAILERAIALVRSLSPRPGAQIPGAPPAYVIPDVLVTRQDGHWVVELNPETVPRLRINKLYARSVNGAHSGLREQLQEARWLIRSLELRHNTLLKVAGAIVHYQQAFLADGPEAMRPMILRDLAEAVGLHESTISRVTTQKYMHTPRGIYEFKYFFSSHVGTSDGGEQSATAVQAMIKKLINTENPLKPLSDNHIAKTLVKRGINVARRTVTKYREALAIPASHERKRLDPRL